ncbi:molybdopterin-dependent oxidoreductase [Fulvivirgaceae bacterium BMA10]|uniref:Molybdopterin-dependent oxidoreductase n=1 Tax=Splendidivirga corallicola TaxID=3051826 RepID=A0ABT8KU76_9BACT|nr:molybdopterin-dependent oxidoreductase [Fulvivirgaceae bacterium BMA10]
MLLNRAESYKTTCSYCGVGCGIIVHKDSNGRISIEGDKGHPVNRGMLCSKGMNLHYTVADQTDRLLYPQMRWGKNQPRQRVDWEVALNRAAAVFKTLISKYGPDSVGFYISGQCLTEEYYLVNKLVKGFIGTNNIDTNSRLCMSSAVAGYKMALGEDAVPISYDDIELADCFFIAGANPAWCHPILFRRIEQHKQKNPQIKVIIVDPRKTQSCALADLHLQIRPGTDIVLYQAIARILIENGAIDQEFIARHTEGYASFRASVMQTSLEEAASVCDVTLQDIRKAATFIGNAKGFISMWAMGLNQSVVGVKKNVALINLSLITGHIGKPGSGPFSLTGQPNAMGGREVGGMANLLAAHRDLTNTEHRKEVAAFWGVDKVPEKPGLTATQMIDALHEGKMKAIWIICTNPLVSLPNATMADLALKKAKFVVVQDISMNSDTAQYADLLLPAAGWLEKEGTMTNADRRISHLSKVVEAPGEALPDSEIICRFAKKMGYHGFDFKDAAEIYLEHCQLTKGTNIDVSGLNYKILKNKGTMQWPVPLSNQKGTPRLFTDKRFYTVSGKAQIHTIDDGFNLSEPLTTTYPLILTTGRIRDQWHTMTRTGKVNKLKQHISKPFLEIHPIDAIPRQIAEGDSVIVSNKRGSVSVSAVLTEDIKPGVVFLPMHWGRTFGKDFSRTNNLTNSLLDPSSKQPDFKFSAVEVKKYVKPKEKIVVVGAGAASFRFINSYREKNTLDEIHVFSKEKDPFYNRVLLPEYVSDHLTWEDLKKFKEGELAKLDVHLHKGIGIESINSEAKTVTDTNNTIHSYDKLILATGSRAFIPKDVPIQLPRIFSMRTRPNADALKKYLKKDAHALIIGGGLLGLELAASLREIDIEVSIVQLTSRLMERQLDPLAGELLNGIISEMGITVYFNDQVQNIFSNKKNDGLKARLKSGKLINCEVAIYAIGTRPNIEIAKEAGLECKRGVMVNEYLQTSDENIFALGEIAEFQDMLYGITAAAEQQAEISAKFIAGDLCSYYTGSLLMNILKLANLDLCSMGMVTIPDNSPDYEEILFIDKSQRYYKKCIIYQDRMVGAILMGDKSEFVEFKTLIENKVELSEKRLQLLRSGQPMEPVMGKLVCSCNHVGEGNLIKMIEKGCDKFNDLCQATGAGLGCGSCKPEVQAILSNNLVSVLS